MQGYRRQNELLADYLALFQALDEAPEAGRELQAAYEQICAYQQAADPSLPLIRLREAAGLSEELFFTVVCALCMELDGGLRLSHRLRYGCDPDINGALTLYSRLRTVDFGAARQFAPDMRAYRLLFAPPERQGWWLDAPLRLKSAVAALLITGAVPVIDGCAPRPLEAPPCAAVQRAALEEVRAKLDAPVVYISGPPGSGKRTLLHRACAARGEPLILADLNQIAPEGEDESGSLLVLSGVMKNAVLGISAGAERASFQDRLRRLARRWRVRCAVLCEEGEPLPLDMEAPVVAVPSCLTAEESAEAWAWCFPSWPGETARAFGMRHRYSIGRLTAQARRAQRAAAGRDVGPSLVQRHMSMRSGAGFTVQRPPEGAKTTDWIGEQSVCSQLRLLAFEAAGWQSLRAQWGVEQSGSTVFLFHGPSGTGKTYAASLLAAEAGLPMMTVELSQVEDKYVGETEKHLNVIFQTAEADHCLLFIDEADALFAKRTEVASSNDRFANLSTAYLLQRLEQYQGVAVLATNLLQNFDDAFARRLQAVVRFSMPDEAHRALLWRRYLPAGRQAADVDCQKLASLASLSPARIRAAAGLAAILAAQEGAGQISWAHAAAALDLELRKTGGGLPPQNR